MRRPARCAARACWKPATWIIDLVPVCFLCSLALTDWVECFDPRGKQFPTWCAALAGWLEWLRSGDAAMPGVKRDFLPSVVR